MKKKEMTELLGYEPGRGQRLEILKIVKSEGISIQEATSRFQLPDLFIKDENGMIEYLGEKILPAQFQEKHPYKKFVTIGRKKSNNEIIS